MYAQSTMDGLYKHQIIDMTDQLTGTGREGGNRDGLSIGHAAG